MKRLLVLLGVVGVSLSAIFVRWSTAPSLILALYRMAISAALMAVPVLLGRREELKALSRRDVALCLISGVFLGIHFGAYFAALRATSIASAVVLVDTEVFFVAGASALVLGQKLTRRAWLCILLAFGGSAILALAGGGQGSEWYGNILALLAAFFVALYTLIGRIQRGYLSTTVYTFLTYLVCFLTLLIMALASGTPLVGYGGREWLIGLGLTVLCTLMGHSLFSWCLKYLSPAYVSAAKLCEPVFSGVLAVPLFGEIPAPMQLLGAGIILGAVLLYTWAERKET